MNARDTARLVVNSGSGDTSLGPLTIDIVPVEPAEVGSDVSPFTLSSGHRSHEVDLAAGRYAVVARRPNGERITRVVQLDAGTTTVPLAELVAPSPNEFMTQETLRGEVAVAKKPGFVGELTGSQEKLGYLQGPAGRALRALAVKEEEGEEEPRSVSPAVARQLTLRVWGDSEFEVGWHRGHSFLKVNIRGKTDRAAHATRAVSLCDESGFGPIIVVPPFHAPLEITFLSEALGIRAAARFMNPSGQRVAVAIPNLQEGSLADLLAALAVPNGDDASTIWTQIYGDKDVRSVLDQISVKWSRPAEALLAAHFLLRYRPDLLPLSWTDELINAVPDVADGPVIAAWRRLSTGPDSEATHNESIDAEFERLMALALARPCAWFARTRWLLSNGLRFSSSRDRADTERLERFVDYGGHAGGLEAFWGTHPYQPGRASAEQSREGEPLDSQDIATVTLLSGAFVACERLPPKPKAVATPVSTSKPLSSEVPPARPRTQSGSGDRYVPRRGGFEPSSLALSYATRQTEVGFYPASEAPAPWIVTTATVMGNGARISPTSWTFSNFRFDADQTVRAVLRFQPRDAQAERDLSTLAADRKTLELGVDFANQRRAHLSVHLMP